MVVQPGVESVASARIKTIGQPWRRLSAGRSVWPDPVVSVDDAPIPPGSSGGQCRVSPGRIPIERP